ncbi:MAG: TetR/AcrR family transcriptional regulator [Bacillota bacterium]|nr:TetR/AcrR family transcriptional regulator [Bacillota bacterium]
MDRRIKRTKETIYAAFRELLSEENYMSISASQIIERANIGRATFYAHFKDKDDLMNSLCRDIFEHIFEDEPEKEEGHDFSDSDNGPTTKLTHLFYHLEENKDDFLMTLGYKGGGVYLPHFQKYIHDYFSKYLYPYIKPEAEKKMAPSLVRASLDNGFVGFIQWWMREDLSESPEVIFAYFRFLSENLIDWDAKAPLRPVEGKN